jgi:two-component system OmpR family response regulator
MPNPQTILIVDDEPHIREVVVFALAKAGYSTLEAADGEQALALVEQGTPDLVVLDIMLPDIEGTEICRRIRTTSQIPILFLSSKNEEIDRVLGLELGGDDYVTKPFSPRELVARVRAILRRADSAGGATDAEPLRHNLLQLDLERCRAVWDGREVILTATEFNILRALLGRPGKVYSRRELMERTYEGASVVSERTLDSHVRRVREKFREVGGDPIETVHGFGYKLGPCQ